MEAGLMDTAASFDIALLIVRVGLGLTLAAHGYNKFFGGGRIPGTAGWFESIGMKPGKLHAVLAATTEITAGLLFAAGLLTTFSAAGFVGLMVVASLLVHGKSGFFIVSGGWEYTFVLALVSVAVSMIGAGKWSLDNAIEVTNGITLREYFDSYWGLIISAGGGTVAALLLLAVFYRKPAPQPEASDS